MSDAQTPDYFGHVRRDIAGLLPDRATRILDIGCGKGATLAWLKDRYPDAETVGIEGFADNEPILSKAVDRAIIADLDEPLPEVGRFDLILALDVLEHLYDPDRVLKAVTDRLLPGGVVIVSVPNVAHWQISVPLLFRQQFDYVDAGMMDRTHIRWFTKKTALQMMDGAGLTVTRATASGYFERRDHLIDLLTLRRAEAFTAAQFLMRGEREGTPFARWGRFPR